MSAQAEQGLINYVHDGSESVADNFTLIANDTVLQRHSMPCVVFVNVTPVDDEAPIVTVNRILKVSFLLCPGVKTLASALVPFTVRESFS